MKADPDVPSYQGCRVLVLDHRDSFVFSLVDQFAGLGCQVRTLRTDLSVGELESCLGDFAPDLLVLSPGPGSPVDAGVMVPFLRSRPRIPVIGICLGHQAMAAAAGGRVAAAPVPVHGRASTVVHHGDPIFAGIPTRFAAARYHSLHVAEPPAEFEVLAHLRDEPGTVMAMRHRSLGYVGLQFHPESVLTPFGNRLIANLLSAARSA